MVGRPEFSMDYEAMRQSANTLHHVSTEYQTMDRNLQTLRDELTSNAMQGQTGQAASAYLEQVQGRLRVMINKINEMHSDLLVTLQDVSGNIDPGMAARFDN